MASDPALRADVHRMVSVDGLGAAAALVAAADAQAAELDAIDDAFLAARAADVRSLGRRAARAAQGINNPTDQHGPGGVVVARELGPADVAELSAATAAIALAGGGATDHAAIVARSLGVPMVVGVGDQVLDVIDGAMVVVDGDAGAVLTEPDVSHVEAAQDAAAARAQARLRARATSAGPAMTSDGVHIAVLANVASRCGARQTRWRREPTGSA